ncbi:GYF domain-containing protein [Cognatilysobacter terrigena]|uniref:GYF domain-containing protein n=1 Tax=Cognatilysobacter terrigena TaxID=2488749 RepID=UPI00141526BF|nr:GYF domain-containing protein [Lysobacter terrigena]
MDWFYHDPGQGRVGPLTADELRNRYRDRRIQLDTLVWREGLREWQPLDRVADELDLLSVKPDASRPPPLPPGPAAGVGGTAYATNASPGYAPAYANRAPGPGYRAAPPPKRGMSGCLIALIVVGVLAIPMIGILAAIALPAYNDYVIRSKVAQQADMRAKMIEMQFAEAKQRLGRCPQDASELGAQDAGNIKFGQIGDGRCGFEITLRDPKPQIDGKTILYVEPTPPSTQWDCTGGDLPARYRNRICKPETDGTP